MYLGNNYVVLGYQYFGTTGRIEKFVYLAAPKLSCVTYSLRARQCPRLLGSQTSIYKFITQIRKAVNRLSISVGDPIKESHSKYYT